MNLTIDAEIPSFVRETGIENWNRYAAVMDEFVPIHMDDAAGQKAGFAGAIGMGNLQWAYFHNVVRDWLGDNGAIKQMTIQFQQPNFKDTTVTARGKITAVEDTAEGKTVTLELWTEDNNDRRLAGGQAKVLVTA
jgi:acyl dehydratase